ncbi:hypothetical protein [Streptomyces sp. NPDC051636]|uniref:hypothetical protein n=1 Tax=Streptomyces sp. NPDC051636 TaxID=3365663 RepID=UPI0037AF82C0
MSGRDADGVHRPYGVKVPADAERGRVTDDRTVPALLGTALLLGGVLALAGAGVRAFL